MGRWKAKALENASEEVIKASAVAEAAAKDLGQIGNGKALVAHAKGKWIGSADKGIAAANEALAKAKTAAERRNDGCERERAESGF